MMKRDVWLLAMSLVWVAVMASSLMYVAALEY